MEGLKVVASAPNEFERSGVGATSCAEAWRALSAITTMTKHAPRATRRVDAEDKGTHIRTDVPRPDQFPKGSSRTDYAQRMRKRSPRNLAHWARETESRSMR